MTREEEIKARLEKAQVNASSYPVAMMDSDMTYILARNEELQQRVEKMQAVVDAADNLETMAWDLVGEIPTRLTDK